MSADSGTSSSIKADSSAVPAGPILLLVVLVGAFVGVLMFAQPPDSWATAVEESDVAMAQRLLAAGVDPDTERSLGFTPLMRAVIRDDAEMVGVMLQGGADPSLRSPGGLAPIHLAAESDAIAALEVLLQLDHSVHELSGSGLRPIDHAARTGSLAVLELLVKRGVDLDSRSQNVSQGHGYPRDRGATPLMLAVMHGQRQAATLLLDLGADVNAGSASGGTPLLIAVFTDQDPALLDLLLEAGADTTWVVACDAGCSEPPGDALDWAHRLDRRELILLIDRHR